MVFGGIGSSGNPLGDTWIFSDEVWTEVCSGPLNCGPYLGPGGPAPRWGAALIYSGGWVFLYGGCATAPSKGVCNNVLSDLWFTYEYPQYICTLPHGTQGVGNCTGGRFTGWYPITTSSGPIPQCSGSLSKGTPMGRYDMAASAIPGAQYPYFYGGPYVPAPAVVIFGGGISGGMALNDTWWLSYLSYPNNRAASCFLWLPIGHNGAPPPRLGTDFAQDNSSNTSNFIIFGGMNGSTLYGNTWELESPCNTGGVHGTGSYSTILSLLLGLGPVARA